MAGAGPAMTAVASDDCVASSLPSCSRPSSSAGAFAAWVALARSVAPGAGPANLDDRRRSQRQAVARAYAMADGRWRLPVDARPASIRPISNCCWRMRTGGTTPTTASIRRRWAAPRGSSSPAAASSPAVRPSRCRSRDCWNRGESARSLPSCARRSAPCSSSGADKDRDPRPLSDAGALRRQSRGRSRRLDRLFRQGAQAAVAGGSGPAGGAAAVAGDPPARSSPRCRADCARPRARPHRRGRAPACQSRTRGRPRPLRSAAAQADADPRAAFAPIGPWRA